MTQRRITMKRNVRTPGRLAVVVMSGFAFACSAADVETNGEEADSEATAPVAKLEEPLPHSFLRGRDLPAAPARWLDSISRRLRQLPGALNNPRTFAFPIPR
jgi:hypothetical protein